MHFSVRASRLTCSYISLLRKTGTTHHTTPESFPMAAETDRHYLYQLIIR